MMNAEMSYPILCLLLAMMITPTSGRFRFIAMAHQRSQQQCQKVQSQTCLTKVGQGYNSTMFPNHLGHLTQGEAMKEFSDFEVLIESGCSEYLSTFLCSLYFPICTPGLLTTVKPCRSLCEKSKLGCANILQKYGYQWRFNCTEFPDAKNSREICVGATAVDAANQVTEQKNQKKDKKKKKGRI